jgi:hypothetical protein
MLALSLLSPLCLGSSQKWKTFESKEWGFRIKYPAEWGEVRKTVIRELPGNENIKSHFEVGFQSGDPPFMIAVLVGKNSPALEKLVDDEISWIQERLEKKKKAIEEEAKERNIALPPGYLDSYFFEVNKREYATLDGEKAIKLETISGRPERVVKGIAWFTVHTNKTYNLYFHIVSPNLYYKEYANLLEEIYISFSWV